jgi:hypothetical protein
MRYLLITFDGQVGLIFQMPRKIIRAELIARNKRVGNQELSPLIKEIKLIHSPELANAGILHMRARAYILTNLRVVLSDFRIA